MAKYQDRDGAVVEAVQLLWTTWEEMCDFAGVGPVADGKSEGCLIGGTMMGLIIPKDDLVINVVPEGHYVFRGESGALHSLPPDVFEQRYTLVDALVEDSHD